MGVGGVIYSADNIGRGSGECFEVGVTISSSLGGSEVGVTISSSLGGSKAGVTISTEAALGGFMGRMRLLGGLDA